MPTAGSSEKQQRRPGPTERMLSAVILSLVVLVVLAFVISGGLFAGVIDRTWGLRSLKSMIGLSEERLFSLEPGSLSPAAPPVEIQIARSLLPVPDGHAEGYGHYAAYIVRSGDMCDVIREQLPPFGGRKTIVRGSEKADELIGQAAGLGADRLYTYTWSAKGSGFLLRLSDMGQPENARKLCLARQPAGSKVLSLGRGGWQNEANGDCGFWTGRYYTEVTWINQSDAGRNNPSRADLLRQIATSLAGGQLIYGGEPQAVLLAEPGARAASPPAGAGRIADFAPVSGGQIVPPTKIDRFTDNLYEKIDGKEGMFRAFHFVELRFGQYTNARTQEAHDVYIYDMGEPVNAFGIYMGERSPKAEAWPLGRSGYVSGTNAYFCKDKYYVNVLGPPEGSEDSLEVSKAIATAIAGTIPDDDKPFWAEEYLPAEDRVPNTLKYEATSGLGYEFIEQVFIAQYKEGDKEYQAFLVQAGDPGEAAALFDKFAEATAKYDKVLSKTSDAAGRQLVGDSMGVFCVAFAKGRFFGGVNECEDQALAVEKAEILKARLPGGEAAPGGASGGTKPAAASAPAEAEKQG